MSGLRDRLAEAIAECCQETGRTDWGGPVPPPNYYKAADAAILALRQWMDAEGLVCVPKTITPEMAWCLENNFAEPLPASQLHANNWQDAYTAMIAAAPDVLGEK